MRRKLKYYKLVWLKYDLPAGLSVFFVALPLCLGIALASGAPLYSGIVAGIIGGTLVSVISGSQLAVSGPAAGLSTVVAASIISLGDYRIFLLTVVVAGVFQLLIGVCKWATIANYFPSAVIKGMLAAIGILLISKQIPIALGYDQPDFWSSGFVSLISFQHFFGNLQNFNLHITRGAILISSVSLVILILLLLPSGKKIKILPAPLVVVVAGIIINMLFTKAASEFSLKPTQLVNIPSNIFKSILFPDFSKLFLIRKFLKTALSSEYLLRWRHCYVLRQLIN